jgi:hypothetical protein
MRVRRADDSLRGPTGERESCSAAAAAAGDEPGAAAAAAAAPARTSASSERESFLSRPASLHE